jgi:hypothetical protein
MPHITADWRDDANGGVFRSLAADNFDFCRPYPVDYNVDFESWPPVARALDWLEASYGRLGLYPPDENGLGYI